MIVKTFSHLLFLPCVVKNPKDCLLTQPGCYPFLSPLCSVVFIRFVPLSRGTENGNRLWFSTILKMPSHWISSPSSLILSDRKLMNVFSLATYDSSWSELIKCYFLLLSVLLSYYNCHNPLTVPHSRSGNDLCLLSLVMWPLLCVSWNNQRWSIRGESLWTINK